MLSGAGTRWGAPRPRIILLGNDEGTAEIARELGLEHIPEIEGNRIRTPLLSSVFASRRTSP